MSLVKQYIATKMEPLNFEKAQHDWNEYLDTEFPKAAVERLSALRQEHQPDAKPIERLTIRQYLQSINDHLAYLAAMTEGNEEFIGGETKPLPAYRGIYHDFGMNGYDKITAMLQDQQNEDNKKGLNTEFISALGNMRSALAVAATRVEWQQVANKENVRFCLNKLDETIEKMLGFKVDLGK